MLAITFESHYASILAKKTLSKEFAISPTPRILSSTCASCLIREEEDRVSDEELEEYKVLSGVEGVYVIKDNKKEVLYER